MTIATVDVNARDGNGQTALVFAALRGRPKNVAALLNAGADVDAQSERGRVYRRRFVIATIAGP